MILYNSWYGRTAVAQAITYLMFIHRMMVELMDPKADDVIAENCTTSLIRIAAA